MDVIFFKIKRKHENAFLLLLHFFDTHTHKGDDNDNKKEEKRKTFTIATGKTRKQRFISQAFLLIIFEKKQTKQNIEKKNVIRKKFSLEKRKKNHAH